MPNTHNELTKHVDYLAERAAQVQASFRQKALREVDEIRSSAAACFSFLGFPRNDATSSLRQLDQPSMPPPPSRRTRRQREKETQLMPPPPPRTRRAKRNASPPLPTIAKQRNSPATEMRVEKGNRLVTLAKDEEVRLTRAQRLAADEHAGVSGKVPVQVLEETRVLNRGRGGKRGVRKVSDRIATPPARKGGRESNSEEFYTPPDHPLSGKRSSSAGVYGNAVEHADVHERPSKMPKVDRSSADAQGEKAGTTRRTVEARDVGCNHEVPCRGNESSAEKQLRSEKLGDKEQPSKLRDEERNSFRLSDGVSADDTIRNHDGVSSLRGPSTQSDNTSGNLTVELDAQVTAERPEAAKDSRGSPERSLVKGQAELARCPGKIRNSTEHTDGGETEELSSISPQSASEKPFSDEETPVIRRTRLKKKANPTEIAESPGRSLPVSPSPESPDVETENKNSPDLSNTPETIKQPSEDERGAIEAYDHETRHGSPVSRKGGTGATSFARDASKTLSKLQELRRVPQIFSGSSESAQNDVTSQLDSAQEAHQHCEEVGSLGNTGAEGVVESAQDSGRDGKDEVSGPSKVSYKVPKPVQRRRPLHHVASSHTVLDETPQNPHRAESIEGRRPESSVQRARFVVDEDGQVNRLGLGAFSQLLSTPVADVNAQKSSEAEAVATKSVRLFKPTANIYSAKKPMLATNPIQNSRPRRPATILRTPGAPTPLKGTSKRSIVWQDLARKPRGQMSTARADANGVGGDDENLGEQIKISVLKSLEAGTDTETKIDEKEQGKDTDLATSPRDELLVRGTTRKLTFASGEEGNVSTLDANVEAPSLTEEARTKVASLLESNRSQQIPSEPRTAPGPGPRSRIEGKQVKSALRCRIESLRAEKSASKHQAAGSGVAQDRKTSEACNIADNGASERDAPPGMQSGQDIISALAASARKPQYPDNAESKEFKSSQPKSGYHDSTWLAGRETSSETEEYVRNANASIKEAAGQHARSVSGNSTSSIEELEKPVGSGSSAEDIDIASAEQDNNMSRSAAAGQSGRGADDINNDAALRSSTKFSPSDIGESLTPDPQSDTSLGTGEEGVANSQEKENQSSASILSNLVSSMTSFLPASFGSQPEGKGAEAEAKAAVLRQRQDAERREAELLARREAQRVAKQKEAEEKQRRAEQRRRMMEEASKHKAAEKKRKEEVRMKKRQEEEQRQRREKEAEDKRKEEHRRKVLEHKRHIEREAQQKEVEVRKNLKEKNGTKLKAYKPGAAFSRLPPSGQSRIPRPGASDRSAQVPPKTPKTQRVNRPEEITSYQMTAERLRGESESSDEMRSRRIRKPIPAWAGKENVLGSLREQKADPDSLFSRVHTCNLEDVFKGETRPYRPRGSSGNWTKDRLTAKEEMEFKRKHGFFDSS